MARRSSANSNTRSSPLVASRIALDSRWRIMTQSITEVLGLSYGTLQVKADYVEDGVWSGFVGSACERVRRHRGPDAYVAPLAELPRGLKAWLGLQERWEIDERNRRQFSFRELSLTVHFGLPGDPLKPQIFRSEWPGLRNWSGAGIGFQSPGVGHPHWQFDFQALFRERQPGMPDPVEGFRKNEPRISKRRQRKNLIF